MSEENKKDLNPKNHPLTLCGVIGGYQIDHIITVKFGFESGISPEKLSQKNNLRILPWKENLKRNRKHGNNF